MSASSGGSDSESPHSSFAPDSPAAAAPRAKVKKLGFYSKIRLNPFDQYANHITLNNAGITEPEREHVHAANNMAVFRRWLNITHGKSLPHHAKTRSHLLLITAITTGREKSPPIREQTPEEERNLEQAMATNYLLQAKKFNDFTFTKLVRDDADDRFLSFSTHPSLLFSLR
jgi:hypothetical protein